MKIIIIIVLLIAVISGVAFWYFSPRIFKSSTENDKPVTLTVWGLFQDQSLIQPAIDEYKKIRPNVTINYKNNTSLNYRSRVQAQVAEGQGPDVFLLHDTWVPMFIKSGTVAPISQNIITTAEFTQTFYPVASEKLVQNDKIYAIPNEVDGLALFYNEDIVKAGNVQIPQNWEQMRTAATKLTVIDQTGKIQTAGLAMGLTGNVANWSDILGLLFSQQPNADLEKPNNASGAEVLTFFTNFAKGQNRVWDETMPMSTDAFASGRLAFYIAPSWRAFEIRSKNPELKFKTAPVPQLGGNTTWGTFWAYGVSNKSSNQEEGARFAKFLSEKTTEQLLYKTASDVRLFGLPYSRVDMQGLLINDPLVAPFVSQAPQYKSWYLSSETHDQAVNDEMIKYYEDAVNSVASGGDALSALNTTAQGVEQVLNKWVNPNP